MSEEAPKVRLDKWLWAVRMFKTRSLATDACQAGRVKIEGKSMKPSYIVKLNDVVSVQRGPKKVLKVLALLEKRVGAPIAAACYEDLAPPPAPQMGSPLDSVFHIGNRLRGSGRPTKKERRELDGYHYDDGEKEATDPPAAETTSKGGLFSLFFGDSDDEDRQ